MDLLTSYSKRADVLYDLEESLRQLRRAAGDDMPPSVHSVRSPDRKSRAWALGDRLSEDDRRAIILGYEAGELRRDIAARYTISVSSVGRILRVYRQSSKS